MNSQASQATRRSLLLGFAAASAATVLQGCVPFVATGVGVGTAMVADRRTSGAFVEDEGIEWRAARALRERFGDGIHVNVTSFDRNVLLTGEAPNDKIREEIGQVVARVDNVRGIVNEVQVAGITSLTSRSNDTLITSKVKARFVDAQTFGAHHVKVVTEAGTVFLLGIVTRREADAATEIARTTAGVQKVVRVFNYVSDEEARRLDTRVGGK